MTVLPPSVTAVDTSISLAQELEKKFYSAGITG